MQDTLEILNQYLCPPGSGVFTVFTARERREFLQEYLYGGIGLAAEEAWRKQLTHALTTPEPLLLGIASDNGGGIMRGANWGPLLVRETFYKKFGRKDLFDLGDVRVIPQLLLDEYCSDELLANCKEALYQDPRSPLKVSPLSIAQEVCDLIHQHSLSKKIFGIGGDHSCSYPLVASYLLNKRSQNKRCALIHFDAHTDLMPKRLGIPICFGSWTYHVLPLLPEPELLIQIGIRSSGRTRDYWQQTLGVRQYWSHEVHEQSAELVAKDICEHLQRKKVDELYITFDIDALDASIANATGTPEKDGLSLDQAKILIESFAKHFPITGADLMEVAPFIHFPEYPNGDTVYAAGEIMQKLLFCLKTSSSF